MRETEQAGGGVSGGESFFDLPGVGVGGVPGAFFACPEGIEFCVTEVDAEADGFALKSGEIRGIFPAEFVAEVVGHQGSAIGGGVAGDGLRLFVEEFGAEFAVVGVGVEVKRAGSEAEGAGGHRPLLRRSE